MSSSRPMSATEIAAIIAELSPLLVNGVVVRVREPMPHHLAIEIRHGGRNRELLLGVAAGISRIHLADNLPPTPPGPCPLTLRARKLMRPSRITGLVQEGGDRVVRLSVSQHREQEDGVWCTSLVAELFGRGRMFLLDGDDRVLVCSGPGGPRGLLPGQPYMPPEAPSEGTVLTPADVDSATLEARYLAWATAGDAGETKRRAEAALAREKKRIKRRIAAMERDLAGLDGWQAIQQEAELLAGHRHLMQRGMTQVTVTDWFDSACPQRTIELDSALLPEENVGRRFKRASKAQHGIPKLTARIADDRAALARLATTDPASLVLPAAAAGKRAPRTAADGYRWFNTVSGWRVYVGRGATDNDRITFRLANGNEFWFHARDMAGAHVLLRGSGEPPQRAIHDAALLAAHYSKLKQAGGGEVMVAQRKYLRRPKGGRPGQVLVTQERVIAVDLTATDMAALLATKTVGG